MQDAPAVEEFPPTPPPPPIVPLRLCVRSTFHCAGLVFPGGCAVEVDDPLVQAIHAERPDLFEWV